MAAYIVVCQQTRFVILTHKPSVSHTKSTHMRALHVLFCFFCTLLEGQSTKRDIVTQCNVLTRTVHTLLRQLLAVRRGKKKMCGDVILQMFLISFCFDVSLLFLSAGTEFLVYLGCVRLVRASVCGVESSFSSFFFFFPIDYFISNPVAKKACADLPQHQNR